MITRKFEGEKAGRGSGVYNTPKLTREEQRKRMEREGGQDKRRLEASEGSTSRMA